MQPLSGPQFPHIGNEQLGFAQVLKLGSTKPRVFFKSQDLGSRREAQGGPASRLLNRGWSLCLHTRNMELKISTRPWTGHRSLRQPGRLGPPQEVSSIPSGYMGGMIPQDGLSAPLPMYQDSQRLKPPLRRWLTQQGTFMGRGTVLGTGANLKGPRSPQRPFCSPSSTLAPW